MLELYVCSRQIPYTVVLNLPQVRRNKHLITDGEQQWTFGQIMALVQLFGTTNEIVHCLISNAPRIKARIQKIWKEESRGEKVERQQGQQESEKLGYDS